MINDLLYKLLPMILALALSQFIYLKFDQKYCITDKVNLKLKVSKEWKPSFSICLIVVSMLSEFIVPIPDIIFFIVIGIFIGVSTFIVTDIKKKKNIYKGNSN
ncbi:hypothetical protein [Clostridium gasigenes]|uniref:hypothetical protein n=1 Tax=Clostridium gasigenes TaxID=94869 RepID=UPI001C0D89FF|nr:hypothetical protein [Clostridium gasigenes]MBU3108706.1 hypothetical protein [Clostridium gasigenes]